jgi:hypothetical protein
VEVVEVVVEVKFGRDERRIKVTCDRWEKVLWRRYTRCTESSIRNRKGGGDLGNSGGDLGKPYMYLKPCP